MTKRNKKTKKYNKVGRPHYVPLPRLPGNYQPREFEITLSPATLRSLEEFRQDLKDTAKSDESRPDTHKENVDGYKLKAELLINHGVGNEKFFNSVDQTSLADYETTINTNAPEHFRALFNSRALFRDLMSLPPEMFAEISELVAKKAQESAVDHDVDMVCYRANGLSEGKKILWNPDNPYTQMLIPSFDEEERITSPHHFSTPVKPTVDSLVDDFRSVRDRILSQTAKPLGPSHQTSLEEGNMTANASEDLHTFFTNLASVQPAQLAEIAQQTLRMALSQSLKPSLDGFTYFIMGLPTLFDIDKTSLEVSSPSFDTKEPTLSESDEFSTQLHHTANSLASDFLLVRAELESQRAKSLMLQYEAGFEEGKKAAPRFHQNHDGSGINNRPIPNTLPSHLPT
ncbi:MAG: hypothetical protein AAF244_02850 [Pseudomonadota bacterium]